MSDFDRLFERGNWVFYAAQMDAVTFEALSARLIQSHPQAVIRLVHGKSSRDTVSFFNEIARALEFPDNRVSWNILNERLYDLTWLPATAYLLMIDHADAFLADAHASQLAILADILDAPIERHFTPGRVPIPRNVLFQCPNSEFPVFAQRLSTAGVRFRVLEGDSYSDQDAE